MHFSKLSHLGATKSKHCRINILLKKNEIWCPSHTTQKSTETMKIINLRHKGMTQPGKNRGETVEETDRGENCFGEKLHNTKKNTQTRKVRSHQTKNFLHYNILGPFWMDVTCLFHEEYRASSSTCVCFLLVSRSCRIRKQIQTCLYHDALEPF